MKAAAGTRATSAPRDFLFENAQPKTRDTHSIQQPQYTSFTPTRSARATVSWASSLRITQRRSKDSCTKHRGAAAACFGSVAAWRVISRDTSKTRRPRKTVSAPCATAPRPATCQVCFRLVSLWPGTTPSASFHRVVTCSACRVAPLVTHVRVSLHRLRRRLKGRPGKEAVKAEGRRSLTVRAGGSNRALCRVHVADYVRFVPPWS